MTIETVRVNKRGKDHLLRLKRHTKIKNWNILCRWAFAISIAEQTPPRDIDASGDAPIEMTWKTFGGEQQELYLAILKDRCLQDHIDPTPENLERQLRLHLHRGISYMFGDPDIKSIEGLIEKARQGAA